MADRHDLSYDEKDVVRRVWIASRRELYTITRVTDRTEEDREKAFYFIITPVDTPPIISGPNGNEVVQVVADLTELENTVKKELNLFEPSVPAAIFNWGHRLVGGDRRIPRVKAPGVRDIQYQLDHSKHPGGFF